MTSIYYQANRNYTLTQSEQEKIDQILKECEENYPFPGRGETLCQCSYDLAEPTCIFSGAAKLPYPCDDGNDMNDEIVEMQTEALFFLIEWLTSLRRVIPDAIWEASLEDVEFIWEEESGYRLMTNEEYEDYC
ncbi:MAG: hypothetical protein E7249_13520 [Paenibacillaceae bacterium]|nr:hypothetical protein [Paenibacillaceae bacterium]